MSGNLSIGIIGAGHIGRTLAEIFLAHGIKKDRLFISHKGSPETLRVIEHAGLSSCLAGNDTICRDADIIFVAIRPQALASLDNTAFPKDRLVVSCMAGIPAELLSRRWNIPVIRMMPSGPDTLRKGSGIAAVFPRNEVLGAILRTAEIRPFFLQSEEEMHVFTAGVCLPAAFLAAGSRDLAAEAEATAKEFPLAADLVPWAFSVLPQFPSEAAKEAYISAMSTKGGITEAIVHAIRSGSDLPAAFRAGVIRCRTISAGSAIRS